MQTQKQQVLDHLAGEVPGLKDSFDGASGRFLAGNGGWAVTMQDVILPLALLWRESGTEWQGKAEILELACRGGDALREAQDDVGRVEFVKVDGSRWGWTYMCWSMLHWLQTYDLLRDALDVARRVRWEEGLRLAYDGVKASLRPDHVHNIPAWHATGLVRGGRLFERPDWVEFGTTLIHNVVAAQHPDGYWAEGFGPTTLYNLVYLHAIGLYYHWTGDDAVLPCLERAVDFHVHFTYPDGTSCETVDGRVKYHARPHTKGGPGFLAVPAGRRFFREQIRRVAEHAESARAHVRQGHWNLQELADAYPYLDDAAAEAAPPVPQELRDFSALRSSRALVRRAGDWFYCLSGYLTPPEKRAGLSRKRWNMDRQNYLSVWREGSGLLVGGGNSKHQPELASFEVHTGTHILCQADRADLRDEGGVDVLRLAYGSALCEIRARSLDEDAIELMFALLEQGPDVQEVLGGFTLPGLAGLDVRTSTVPEPHTLSPEANWGEAWDAEPGWFTWKGARLELCGAYVRWPLYPFNPYAIDGAAPPEQAVGLVGFTLDTEAPTRRFVLRRA